MDDEQIINSLNHLAEQKYLRVAGRSVCKHAADRIDALAAKLAKVEAERDKWYKRAMEMVAERNDARDALPAVYQLGLGAGAIANAKVQAVTKYLSLMLLHVQHESFAKGHGETEPADSGKLVDEARAALSALEDRTFTAAELMARINGPKQRSGGACDFCGYNVQKPCKTKADRQNCEFAP